MKSIRTTPFYAALLPLIFFTTSPRLGAQENGLCVPAPSGLVSLWPGESNANDVADVNHGTPLNGVTFDQGIVGQAFDFGGSLDHVRVENHPSLNFTPADSYTIEFWMKTEELGPMSLGHLTLVEKWARQVTDGYPFAVRLNTDQFGGPKGTILCGVFESPQVRHNAPNVSSMKTIDDGAFHHVACVYDHPTQTVEVYIDGVPDGSHNYTTTLVDITNETHVSFGIRGNLNELTDFNGLLDEISIYGRALSAPEIQAIFECRVPSLIEDLVQAIQELGLPGMAGQAQLNAALDALAQDPPDIQGAIGALQGFINFVNAQSGKKIPVQEAGDLMHAAQAIIDGLSQ
jgi:hypothetical protein